VVLLSLLLLALASVATTSAAPQAGNFGLQIKPGYTVEQPFILTDFMRKWSIGWEGVNTAQRYAIVNANRRGRVGFAPSMIGTRMLYTATANTDCAETPNRWKNSATLSGLAFPNGLHYSNTLTELLTLPYISLTIVYTPVAGWWPAVYSPTFDYRPQAIGCGGVEGIMPPYTGTNTRMWESIYSSP
jgi:hypothetical protein